MFWSFEQLRWTIKKIFFLVTPNIQTSWINWSAPTHQYRRFKESHKVKFRPIPDPFFLVPFTLFHRVKYSVLVLYLINLLNSLFSPPHRLLYHRDGQINGGKCKQHRQKRVLLLTEIFLTRKELFEVNINYEY